MAHETKKLESNILKINFINDIGERDVLEYLQEYQQHLEEATIEDPLHIILDVSQVKKATSTARKAFGEIFKEVDPRSGKSAMIGANRYLRVLAGFVIKATGTHLLRIFNTEEEAVRWLKSE